ncbi:MAG TPA: carbohydrate ABC transporter permease, partial [Chloroflexota bacterium]|nr:carbohydrate ABC transporter permease [Chloroflexota bacterium]
MTSPQSLSSKIVLNVLLVVMILGGIFPVLWLFLTSLKLDGELVRLPITYLPQSPTLRHYVEVFQANPFARFLL